MRRVGALSVVLVAVTAFAGWNFRHDAGRVLAVFLAPLLSSSVPVTRPAGTAVTTTRANTATNYDETQSPALVSSSANTGRYHSVKGLLSEASAVNLALWSESLDVATWNSVATGASVRAVNGIDTIAAPDGTTTAEDITFGATTAGQDSVASQAGNAACAVGTTCTHSVYVKGQSGSGTIDLCGYGSSAGVCAACAFTSTAWARCTLATSGSGTGNVGLTLGNSTRFNGGTVRSSARVYLWGAQTETGAVATSYIRTTTVAVTRSADVHTVPTTGWPTGSGEISFVVTPLTSTAPAVGNAIIDSRTTATTDGVFMYRDASNAIVLGIYGASANVCSVTTAAQTWTAGTPKTVEARWTPTTCNVVADGVVIGSGVATGSPSAHKANANIGSRNTDSTLQFNGWLATGCAARTGGCP